MSRRFLNMVVHEYGTRLYTLCRIDLKKHLFCESTEAAAAAQHLAKAKKMRDGWPSTVSNCKRPPMSEISFSAPPCLASNSKLHFFSLLPGQGEGCVMATDPQCNAAIYDAGMEAVLLLPPANFPKPADSISLSLALPRRPSTPTSHEDDHALFVMNKWDGTFESFNYCKTGVYDYPTVDNKWYWCPLPRLPPWLADDSRANVVNRPSAAAIVDNTTIYVSTSDGTYAYDMRRGIWTHAGNWVLPFHGSAEYVPELGLWFGVKGPDSPQHRLCAFDLNSSAVVDTGPSSLYDWDFLDVLPDEWLPSERRLVNLGSGKFVIVTYCVRISSTSSSDREEDYCSKAKKFSNKELTLLTGVEVVDRGGGVIEMIKHKSQRYNIDNTKIHSVL